MENEIIDYSIYGMHDEYITINCNHTPIGEMAIDVKDYWDMYHKYQDGISSFDTNIMSNFNENDKIVDIEDIVFEKNKRGKKYFRKALKSIFEGYIDVKYKNIILTAHTYGANNFPLDKLVEIFEEFGFKRMQEFKGEKVIMIKKKENNFTNAQTRILEFAASLKGIGFSDRDYHNLEAYFEEENKINEEPWMGCNDIMMFIDKNDDRLYLRHNNHIARADAITDWIFHEAKKEGIKQSDLGLIFKWIERNEEKISMEIDKIGK